MRTNIDIDDELMREAMRATGTETKKAAVEASLRKVVQLKKQEGIRKLRGKVVWRGHDDDWFASDEQILEKRRRAEQDAETANAHHPATERQPVISEEAR
jgi:Arc/MetJ family transcription regulator